MVRDIVKGKKIFMKKAQAATEKDKSIVVIGVNKSIIVVAAGPFQFAMINPVITQKSGEYQTEESCLSLTGSRSCTRYEEIEVDYLDENFKPKHGKYSGYTAQIIQHEIDHCNGVVI